MMIHARFRCEERHETREILYTSLEAFTGSSRWGESCGYCERPLTHAATEARGLFVEPPAPLAPVSQPAPEVPLSLLEKDLYHLLDLVEYAEDSYWPKGHMDRLEAVAREIRARYAV